MIEELIKALESKGLKEARPVVEELFRGGALTSYDASKYLAREEVLVCVSSTTMSTTRVIGDMAYKYRLGYGTVKRALER